MRSVLDERIQSGDLKVDSCQDDVVVLFDDVLESLRERDRLNHKFSNLYHFFFRCCYGHKQVKGIYVYGDVGCGKTMLMDLFFKLAPVHKKRRVHFHEFMAEIQDRIAVHRRKYQTGTRQDPDPVLSVAASIAHEAALLCFDEFVVTNIADAMILSRLFTELFRRGCVVVATSNVAPHDLYRDGINRDIFMPFITVLEKNITVVSLDSGIDYRREGLFSFPLYMFPLDDSTQEAMDKAWNSVTGKHACVPSDILVKGHRVHVPVACRQAARFSFADLCDRSLAAGDFLEITSRFNTVFIDSVPVLSNDRRDQVKRFIMLVDALYNSKVRLVMSAAVAIDHLFPFGKGVEGFEFNRTASRLFEMCRNGYVARHEALNKYI
ncbi:ATPase [Liberibacter crescens]|nr:ATPase [Liberibacter crescens]